MSLQNGGALSSTGKAFSFTSWSENGASKRDSPLQQIDRRMRVQRCTAQAVCTAGYETILRHENLLSFFLATLLIHSLWKELDRS
jgi:hypothetical protein